MNLLFLCAALPTLDIAEGALNKLIDTYKLLLPQLGGYLTHAGAEADVSTACPILHSSMRIMMLC
jgi:5'-3' exonuclease